MSDNLGIASGLLGSQMSGRDTTGLDPKLLAIMAMRRKQNGTDNLPKVNVLDDIKAANEGKRVPPIADSTIKMAHAQWLDHIDKLGYELKKKSQ